MKIASVIMMILVLVVVLYLNKRTKDLAFRSDFSGHVVSIDKQTKGFYLLQIEGQTSRYCISYRGNEGILDIAVGDSIYKENNSNTIFRKIYNTKQIIMLTKAMIGFEDCK